MREGNTNTESGEGACEESIGFPGQLQRIRDPQSLGVGGDAGEANVQLPVGQSNTLWK